MLSKVIEEQLGHEAPQPRRELGDLAIGDGLEFDAEKFQPLS
jgi:hypothetical protein